MPIKFMYQAQDILKSHFECVEDWFAEPELGLRALPISGQFIRMVGLDHLVARIRGLLPSDVKLMVFDGMAARMVEPDDTYLMIFGSKTWEQVEEGRKLPRLEPLFLREAVGNPVWDIRIVSVPRDVECRLVVNKQTHSLSIPKDEETDEQCVVVVRPK